MARLDLLIEDDPENICELLLEVFDSTTNFRPKSENDHLKTQEFVRCHPHYKPVPRSFIRGCFQRGKPVSDIASGFKVIDGFLRVWGMGRIMVSGDMDLLYQPQRFEFAPDRIIVHMPGFKRRKKSFENYDERKEANIYALRKEDPILDFLLVNGVPPGEEMWRKHAVLKHFQENPFTTRKELEKMGLKGDLDWDMFVDFHPALSVWLRAVSKPRDCNILSLKRNGQGQLQQRRRKEKSLPSTIEVENVDKGNMQGQSYELEIFRAMQSRSYSFLE